MLEEKSSPAFFLSQDYIHSVSVVMFVDTPIALEVFKRLMTFDRFYNGSSMFNT